MAESAWLFAARPWRARLTAVVCAALVVGAAPAAAQTPAPDRIAAWNQDLDLVRDRFLVVDRSYTPAARREAAARVERLRARVPRLTDAEVQGELARIAALSDNAHTRAYLLRNRGVWRRYPLRVWRFADGWYVVAAKDDAAPLLGRRLATVAGRPVERAAAAMRPLFAGVDAWAEYMAGYTLTSADALIVSGLLSGDGSAVFTTSDGLSVRVASPPAVRREGPEENWWFLSPAHPITREWRHVLQDRPLPPMLSGAESYYQLWRCDGGVAYLNFNRASDYPNGMPTRVFGERVLQELTTTSPTRLIVDLRFNTGGNLMLARPMFDGIAALPVSRRRGGLYVVTGVNTFSAGLTPVAALVQAARPTLVGESPGDRAIYWAEGGNVRLPNSGIDMHFADRQHHYAPGVAGQAEGALLHTDLDAPRLTPDVRTRWRWSDYIAGHDPVLAAIPGRPSGCRVVLDARG